MTDAGYVFDEVAVTHHFRPSGKSEFFNIARLLRVVCDYSKLWIRLVLLKKDD